MKPSTSRRQFLATVLSGVTVGLAGCPRSPSASAGDGVTPGTAPPTGSERAGPVPDSIGLETLATGMSFPLDVAFTPDADRRYIADKDGRVYVHEPEGLRTEPLLDLRDGVELGLEKGLLGIAVHPDFAENRRFFVRYSAPRRPGTPQDYSHTFVLAEFEASADGRSATPDSERTVLEISQPYPNHNAGSIAFGPDGYLHVGVGNGGGPAGGERKPDDWYDAASGGNGQDVTENLVGSILRIDVDGRGSGRNYAIPDDNPLVGREGLDEQYAWGFRNPWRMSFDGSDLFVADVGEVSYEEVSLVEKGGNYGWNVKEGSHCYQADSCPGSLPDAVRGGEPLVDPVIEYPHPRESPEATPPVSGNSVIGGYVYRGADLPGLQGVYVFADLDTQGRLFVATQPEREGDDRWSAQVVDVAGPDGERLAHVFSFGRDGTGEVYVLGSTTVGFEDDSSGGFYRIVPAA